MCERTNDYVCTYFKKHYFLSPNPTQPAQLSITSFQLSLCMLIVCVENYINSPPSALLEDNNLLYKKLFYQNIFSGHAEYWFLLLKKKNSGWGHVH